MYSIGVVGSRNYPNEEKVKAFVRSLPKEWEIVSGGAVGPDFWSESEARKVGMPVNIHYPQWEVYGDSAGMIRNGLIVRDSHVIIAFYNYTKGTRDTMSKCVIAKKPLFTVLIESDLPTVEEIINKITNCPLYKESND